MAWSREKAAQNTPTTARRCRTRTGSPNHAGNLGSIRDLIFDNSSHKLIALLLSDRELFGMIDATVVPWTQVREIGPNAIMVPVQSTTQKPDGGLIGLGIGDGEQNQATSTNSQTASTSASSTEPVGQAPLTDAEAQAADSFRRLIVLRFKYQRNCPVVKSVARGRNERRRVCDIDSPIMNT